MKVLITCLLLTLIQTINSPIGVWQHKEDNSRIEIKDRNGKLYGALISSKNPNYKKGQEIIRNIEFKEDQWSGEFYLQKSDRWVAVTLEIKEDILFLEYNYGFLDQKIHFYRE